MQVLFDEIPRIRGSIDGCQQATNETRNDVLAYSQASIKVLEEIPNHLRIT
jgi:hypothetical protein